MKSPDPEDATRAIQELAAIVDSTQDAIISKSLDGVILTWNRAAEKIFGYTAEEIVGKPIYLLIPPERESDEDLILGRIRRGERVEHYETVRRRKDGSLINVAITVSPIFDSRGNVIAASKIARDVTERSTTGRASEHLAAIIEFLGRCHHQQGHERHHPDLEPVCRATLWLYPG